MNVTIRPFRPQDKAGIIALWRNCNLVVPWNDPAKDIEMKLAVDPELFLVAVSRDGVVGSAMGGYEGHRGWIYYLAVHPDLQRTGLGSELVSQIEELLAERNCPKVNLMVRRTNTAVISFYEKLGYEESDVVCLGKKLPPKD